MSKTYSAGIVTAYGAAKRAGYQGTYEDFCRQQAQYAENAQTVEQAKNTAVSAATTATTKAMEATTAATAAQTAKTQTEQAASQALTDIAAARSGAISTVQTEGATQITNATAQAQAAATSATTASTKASEASASATSAGQSATNAAASATSAATSASAAQVVLESIPEDYSDLSEDVDKLKADLGDNVNDLKSALSIVEGAVYKERERTVTATVSGFRLNESNGLCSSNGSYKMDKYTVTAGDVIKVVSDDRFQFQNAFRVPASGPNYRVGKTYGVGSFLLEVPETATYLIVSTPTESSAKVYDISGSVKDDIQNLNSALFMFPLGGTVRIQAAKPDNGRAYGSHELPYAFIPGETVRVTNNGNVKINFSFYNSSGTAIISPAVQSGEYSDIVAPTNAYYAKIYSDSYPIDVVIAKAGWATKTDATINTLNKAKALADCYYTTGANYTWELGTIDDGTGEDVASTNRIRSELLYVVKGTRIHLTNDNYNHVVCGYTIDGKKRAYIQNTWTTNDVVADEDGYYKIVIRKQSNAAIDSGEIGTIAGVEYINTPSKSVNDIFNVIKNQRTDIDPRIFETSINGHGQYTAGAVPSNSLLLVEKQRRDGIIMTEVDVAFTSDNIPVLLHDTTINGMARNHDGTQLSSTINISDITYEDCLDYYFNEGKTQYTNNITTLEEYLKYSHRFNMLCELDLAGHTYTDEQYQILVTLLEKLNMIQKSVFTLSASVGATKLLPLNKNIILVATSISNTPNIDDAVAKGAKFVSIQYQNLTPSLCEYAHNKGLYVKTWTLSTASNCDQAFMTGADLINTDGLSYSDVFGLTL